MKKIFFIFAMLLMSVVSVMAEELSEAFSDEELKNCVGNYQKAHFTVTADRCDDYGLFVHNGNKITIMSRNGEKITKVVCRINSGTGNLTADRGTPYFVDYHYQHINNVNYSSMQISSDVKCAEGDYDYYFEIDYLTIYYEYGNGENSSIEADPTIADECVLTESFPTSGDSYFGDNIKVETNSNGLYIGNNKTVTINSNNGADVRIFEVELEFNNNFYGTINTLDGATVEGSDKNWTISNIYSPNLTISSTTAAQIKSINVHYVKMSEEQSVAITTTSGKKYIEGNITVLGTKNTGTYGLDIDKGQSVTITSNHGALISKVEFHLSYRYFDHGEKLDSELGDGTHIKPTGSDRDWTISNINSSSVTTTLTVSHDGDSDGDAVRIDRITVYYQEPVAPTEIQLVAASAEGAYWTTFYSNACHYQAPEGTEVYKVNLSGSTITMNKINDGIVTKGEGVVLKSLNSANITLTKVDNRSTDDYYGNSLKGTSTEKDNPGNAYVLSYKDTKGLAFYKLKSTGKIPANKAYLLVPSGSSAAAQAFFAFDTATTTGVENINAQESSEQEEKVYDLQGRRVVKPAKGLYIVNGKKVIMK